MFRTLCLLTLFLLSAPSIISAQAPPIDLDMLRNKLAPLAMMDGQWRGTAEYTMGGNSGKLTQTERVGPGLGGWVKMVEGRGYDAEGKTRFNAFGVIAYDPTKESLVMRSYAEGRVGDFPLQITESGFRWEIQAGPATIRYTATIKNGKWRETGERIIGDQPPVQFFEMNLEKIGDTQWPATDPVPVK